MDNNWEVPVVRSRKILRIQEPVPEQLHGVSTLSTTAPVYSQMPSVAAPELKVTLQKPIEKQSGALSLFMLGPPVLIILLFTNSYNIIFQCEKMISYENTL